MSKDNIYFLPVKDFYHADYTRCTERESAADLAASMCKSNVSSIVVCRDDQPFGIVTDRDLRTKVVAGGLDPRSALAEEVMSSPIVTVNENEYLFEVLYQMSHHRVGLLGVTNSEGQIVGIVNNENLFKLQSCSPQLLLKEIATAETVEALKYCHAQLISMVVSLNRTGVRTRDLARLISELNDEILVRLITIIKRTQFPELTDRFAFVVLGSEGRGEQTLSSDQDNAIIYGDDLTADELTELKAFSEALIDALIEIGVPPCPGGIMAKNDIWRRSVSEWGQALKQWISTPTPENILNFSMFSDVRTVYGEESLVSEIRQMILNHAGEELRFLSYMAANVQTFPPPLGFLGRLKTEKSGENAGLLDLKKAGIFSIAEGVKILGIQNGLLGGGTWTKIEKLAEMGVLERRQADDLWAAFNLLVFLRVRGQVGCIEQGSEPSNHIDPGALNRVEKGRLHIALDVVKSFHGTLKHRFQTNNLAN